MNARIFLLSLAACAAVHAQAPAQGQAVPAAPAASAAPAAPPMAVVQPAHAAPPAQPAQAPQLPAQAMPVQPAPLAGVARAPAPPAPPTPPVATLPADAPKIVINGGVYSESPAARAAIVNGHVAREGDDVGSGVVLEQIRPQGVVLAYRGARYTVVY